MDFKDHWDLDTAIKVVQNKTVDSKLWAEAIEWLLLYGPPEIITVLMQASSYATDQIYPDLKAVDYTNDGVPYYDITQLAQTLSISEFEVRKTLSEKDLSYPKGYFFSTVSSKTVH